MIVILQLGMLNGYKIIETSHFHVISRECRTGTNIHALGKALFLLDSAGIMARSF
jgi:hypothetical protein